MNKVAAMVAVSTSPSKKAKGKAKEKNWSKENPCSRCYQSGADCISQKE